MKEMSFKCGVKSQGTVIDGDCNEVMRRMR